MNTGKPTILLYSTLNPFPHWAGSENLWYDLVQWKGAAGLQFKVRLADSPVTRQKSGSFNKDNLSVAFYPHHNVHFARRNFYRLKDKLSRAPHRTQPWYDEISTGACDLVFFNVAALADLAPLSYATEKCRKAGIPYWLLLQHGYEDFFLHSEDELNKLKMVVKGAKRFVFISQRNRLTLERAMGEKLTNASHSVNAISREKMDLAGELAKNRPPSIEGRARFFNLGRFSPRDKAQHLLLESFAGMKWKERDWQLSFIGISGFGKTSLETMIKYYSLPSENIHIIPHTDNVLQAIIQEDVLLMPSLSEGTPFAMVESMACGRPALGTPVGGIPELIRDGETGWLSKSTDAGAIAEALEQCWEDRKRWSEMGNSARKNIAFNYNEENSFPQLVQWMQEDMN